MIQLIDKSQCCGCGACSQVCPKNCIDLLEDAEGFLYPKVKQDTCINCGLCEKVCPELNIAKQRKPLSTYAAKNPHESIRMKSSSGGVFSIIAEQVITRGGVVFGARFDDKWEVVHGYTETVEGLSAFRGSKYVQSRVGDSFKQAKDFLKEGRLVLFSGTPCQIMALKLFLRKEYANLLTIDIICHGVPSPKVWNLYLNGIGHRAMVKEFEFRNKSTGWKKYSLKCISEEKTIQEEYPKNTYMRTFLSNLPLRLSCYKCCAKQGRSNSDITLGDFWGIEKVYPHFDDDKGCGSLLVYKKEIVDFLQESDLMEVKYDEILAGNPSLEHSVRQPINRSYFFHLVSKGKSLQIIYNRCFSDSYLMRVRRILYRKFGI